MTEIVTAKVGHEVRAEIPKRPELWTEVAFDSHGWHTSECFDRQTIERGCRDHVSQGLTDVSVPICIPSESEAEYLRKRADSLRMLVVTVRETHWFHGQRAHTLCDECDALQAFDALNAAWAKKKGTDHAG